jgi:hypothetical protein
VTAIIISSIGAVYAPSLKALKRILNCGASELYKLGKKMSEGPVRGARFNGDLAHDRAEQGTGSDVREGR